MIHGQERAQLRRENEVRFINEVLRIGCVVTSAHASRVIRHCEEVVDWRVRALIRGTENIARQVEILNRKTNIRIVLATIESIIIESIVRKLMT